MSRPQLYAHPFSSYCQKALTALYENDTPFDLRLLAVGDDAAMAELEALWPLRKFPVLQDGERVVVEATAIIEHLAVHHPGPSRLIPDDPAAAVEVRMLDRVFDLYVSNAQQKFVIDSFREPGQRDPAGVEDARRTLMITYAWLDRRLQDREWAAGGDFSLADCAAGPALFYADWTVPIPDGHEALLAYRARLLQRPSFARCIEEARPYRPFFPLPVPERGRD